jgi:hypothetical protein
MGRRRPVLDPANMQAGMGKVDLVPTKIHQLTDPEPMTVGDQDHGGIAMPPAVRSGRLEQLLDLTLGQVFAGTDLGIRTPSWSDCPINGGWGDDAEG